MNPYIFESHREDKELTRLRLIESALDPSTIHKLQKTGIGNGWRCLELGPGAGSIMSWMGETVGEKGLVLGIDKDTKHLQGFDRPPYRTIEGDFNDISLDRVFDLVHCRYVLIHNKNDGAILKKIHRNLNPGGYLLIEEPDFMSAKTLNDYSDIPAQRVNSAACRMFTNMGLDPGYGMKLPKKLVDAGYQIMNIDSRIHLCEGKSPIAKVMAASTEALRKRYIATGEVCEEDIKNYIENTGNSHYWSVYYATVSVLAKISK